MTDVKLAIIGSMYFKDECTLQEIADDVIEKKEYNPIEILCGNSKGTDEMTQWYAEAKSYNLNIVKVNYMKYGKQAKHKITEDIIDQCDVCLCFSDGYSQKCDQIIELCEKYDKVCHVFNYKTKVLELVIEEVHEEVKE